MADGFRITSIHLDKNENFSGVRAFVDNETFQFVQNTLGDVRWSLGRLGVDPIAVVLSMDELRALEKACVDARDAGLDNEITRDIHRSLDRAKAMTAIKF